MLKRLFQASVIASALGSAAAIAAPFIPINGPTSVSFTNREQICVNSTSTGGCITAPSGATEVNWGIAQVDTVRIGNASIVGDPPNSIIQQTPGVQFTGTLTAQITAIFYGLAFDSIVGTTLVSSGGFLDVYYDEVGLATGGTMVDISTALPAGRTADDVFTGFTDGRFLVRIAFASGIDPTNMLATISGSAAGLPTNIVGTGSASGYGNVVAGAVNHQGQTGLWEDLVNTEFFKNYPTVSGGGPLAFGDRDMNFRNTFSLLSAWSGACDFNGGASIPGTCIGALSSDPITFFAPEPGVLGLLGLALLGLAGFRRRA